MQKIKRKQIDFGGTVDHFIKGDGTLGNINDIILGNSFVFTLSLTEPNNAIVCDKTIDEIFSAIQEGRTVVAAYNYNNNIVVFSANIEIVENTIIALISFVLFGGGVLPFVGSKENGNDVWIRDVAYRYLEENSVTKLENIEDNAQRNVQSDWDQTDNSKDDYIKNKPNIPSKTSDLQNDSNFATQNDIPNISGKADKVNNATNNHFAALDANGNLKDSGKKASDFATTASLSNYYTKSQVDSIVASVYKPQGSIPSLSNLGSLDANHYGYVYNIDSAFVTTSDFVEGADVEYSAGTNVVIINVGTEENPIYKYDVLGSFVDLSPFARTIDLAPVATSNDYNDLTNKPDIPATAVFIVDGIVTQVGDNLSLSCNKTIAEIIEAHQAGKNVIMVLSDNNDTSKITLPLTVVESNSVFFTSILVVFGLHLYYVNGENNGSTDEWSINAYTFPNLFFSASYTDLVDTPSLGTAAALDVPASGDASTTEVVKGDDTRLSDARQASDVYPWAKNETKPSYTASEVGAISTTEKGVANGVATLDSNGVVPASQLPPEATQTLTLGETSSTAYAGDKGKANADAISAIKDGTTIDSFGDVETALANKQDILQSMTTTEIDTIWNTIII